MLNYFINFVKKAHIGLLCSMYCSVALEEVFEVTEVTNENNVLWWIFLLMLNW